MAVKDSVTNNGQKGFSLVADHEWSRMRSIHCQHDDPCGARIT